MSTVPVYLPNSTQPIQRIPILFAKRLLRENFAIRVNGGRAIRLLKARFDFRGLSCTPSQERAVIYGDKNEMSQSEMLAAKLWPGAAVHIKFCEVTVEAGIFEFEA